MPNAMGPQGTQNDSLNPEPEGIWAMISGTLQVEVDLEGADFSQEGCRAKGPALPLGDGNYA